MNLSLFGDEDIAPEGADVAYTPRRLARAVVQALHAEIGLGLTWEPHAGGGAFVQALADEGIPWVASTLEPADSKALSSRFGREIPARDALLPCPWTPAAVVGNCPFSNAEAHVVAALEAVKPSLLWTVAFVLPLSFACREKHAHLFPRRRSWGLWPINPRPTFTGPGRASTGTAMTDVGVYVFSSAPIPARVISW